MPLHHSANVRASCDVCNVTSQGHVMRVHGEETPRPREAVAPAQKVQHTSRANSVLTVFSVLVSDTVMVPPSTFPPPFLFFHPVGRALVRVGAA